VVQGPKIPPVLQEEASREKEGKIHMEGKAKGCHLIKIKTVNRNRMQKTQTMLPTEEPGTLTLGGFFKEKEKDARVLF